VRLRRDVGEPLSRITLTREAPCHCGFCGYEAHGVELLLGFGAKIPATSKRGSPNSMTICLTCCGNLAIFEKLAERGHCQACGCETTEPRGLRSMRGIGNYHVQICRPCGERVVKLVQTPEILQRTTDRLEWEGRVSP
jgi:hypothetical protein